MPEICLLSVGNGDTSYIKHGNGTFTLIDCCIDSGDPRGIIDRIAIESRNSAIKRFISTHPDDDHIRGIHELDQRWGIDNFYCVKNFATKPDSTPSFDHYKTLRDGEKCFEVWKGRRRAWLNSETDGRGGAGLTFLWPDRSNANYQDALFAAALGKAFNDISCIVRYSLIDGVSCVWLGDLTTGFMENIEDSIHLEQAHIVIAAHHGRKSGKIPDSWLKKLNPSIIVIGEAPSRDLHYYTGYNTLTQNRCGDIFFNCHGSDVDIYTSKDENGVRSWLKNNARTKRENYIGTLEV